MSTVVFADLVGSTTLFEQLGDGAASRLVTQVVQALSKVFEKHHGRVVKLLGDGLFVVFDTEVNAISACVAIQKQLHEYPIRPGGKGPPIEFQMGVECGEVVEIDGDCYGDAVNSASRLADMAKAQQILTSQRVREALGNDHLSLLRALGPMHLKGKADATNVFQVAWRPETDADATVMSASVQTAQKPQQLHLFANGLEHLVHNNGEKAILGRASSCSLAFDDARVSRAHAAIEWRGRQFALVDTSSFGTFVYFGDNVEPLLLRRTEVFLVGSGVIALGADRHAESAALINFQLIV
jgi:adenylate cyclase